MNSDPALAYGFARGFTLMPASQAKIKLHITSCDEYGTMNDDRVTVSNSLFRVRRFFLESPCDAVNLKHERDV